MGVARVLLCPSFSSQLEAEKNPEESSRLLMISKEFFFKFHVTLPLNKRQISLPWLRAQCEQVE